MTLALSLEFDGADGSTTVTDDSGIAKTITVVGSAQISTTKFKFGSASLRSPGSSSSYVQVTQSASEMTMAGDFSLSLWINRDNYSGSEFVFSLPDGNLAFGSDGGGEHVRFSGNAVGASMFSMPVRTNEWHNYGISRKGDRVAVFRNGARLGTFTYSGTLNFSGMQIGRYAPNANSPFTGYIDRLVLYKDECRWENGYDPETLVATDTLTPKFVDETIRLAGEAPAGANARSIADPVLIRDTYVGGLGRIRGTVKEDLTPTDLPLHRKVRLFREVDGLCVRETWSNATTGAYSFDNIDTTYRYFVVAFDYEQNYRAVIADNLTPELMP